MMPPIAPSHSHPTNPSLSLRQQQVLLPFGTMQFIIQPRQPANIIHSGLHPTLAPLFTGLVHPPRPTKAYLPVHASAPRVKLSHISDGSCVVTSTRRLCTKKIGNKQHSAGRLRGHRRETDSYATVVIPSTTISINKTCHLAQSTRESLRVQNFVRE